MTRTQLNVQEITNNGYSASYQAADINGFVMPNDGRTVLHVKNTGGSPCVVSVPLGLMVDGQSYYPKQVTVPANSERWIGRWPHRIYNQPGENMYVDFDQVSGVTIAALRMNQTPLQLPFPIISGVSPVFAGNGTIQNITIYGSNFFGSPKIYLGTTLLTDYNVVSTKKITVNIPAGITPGTYSLSVNDTILASAFQVRETIGIDSYTGTDGVTINAAPLDVGGKSWTGQGGNTSWTHDTNRAKLAALSGGGQTPLYLDSGNNNVILGVDQIVQGGSFAGVMARYTDVLNNWFTGGSTLYKKIANAVTSLLSETKPNILDTKTRLYTTGPIFSMFRGLYPTKFSVDTNPGNLTNATKIGITSYTVGDIFDNFSAEKCPFNTIFADSATRSDGAIGSTDTGNLAYSVPLGSGVISGNKISLGSAESLVFVDAGQSNGTIGLTSADFASTRGIVFNYSGPGDYMRFTIDASSQATLTRVQGGVVKDITGKAFNGANGVNTISIVKNGSRVALIANGVLLGTYRTTFNQSSTKVGIYSSGSATFSNFLMHDDVTLAPNNAAAPQIIVDSNSLGAGASNQNYKVPPISRAMMQRPLFEDFINWGISGRALSTMVTDFPNNVVPLIDNSRKNIIVMWELTNELQANTDLNSVKSYITQYCALAKATGSKLWVVTCTPRTFTGTRVGFEADRLAINAWIIANQTTLGIDRILDIGNDPNMGQTGQSSNTTYFYDGLHYTDVGYGVWANNYLLPALVAEMGY